MPAQPSWLLTLPSILEQLRASAVPFLDRPAVEKLFAIRRRRAHALMAGFGGYLVGKTFLIDRAQLIAALESLAAGQDFAVERRRKSRLSEELDRTRAELSGRRIALPSPPSSRDRAMADLPEGIYLRPGELRIEFSDAEDLAAKLFELSQAMANDWTAFQKAAAAM